MVIRRAPEAPSGCPSAIAPPRGLSSASVTPNSRLPGQRHRRERLVDLERVDVVGGRCPARASTLWVAGIGPVSISVGSSPTTLEARIRARGRSPSAAARSSLISSRAPAPSVICDELPAVTIHSIVGEPRRHRPRSRTPACSAASRSTVVSGPDRLVGLDLGPVDRRRARSRVEAAGPRRPRRALVRARRVLVQLGAGQPPLVRRPARRRRPAARGRGTAPRTAGRTGRRPSGPSPSAPGSSTRRRRRRRCRTRRRRCPCAANSTACWPEPHLRSMVTDGTWVGEPGGEPGLPARGRGLLAGLADAADQHVVDGRRVDARCGRPGR